MLRSLARQKHSKNLMAQDLRGRSSCWILTRGLTHLERAELWWSDMKASLIDCSRRLQLNWIRKHSWGMKWTDSEESAEQIQLGASLINTRTQRQYEPYREVLTLKTTAKSSQMLIRFQRGLASGSGLRALIRTSISTQPITTLLQAQTTVKTALSIQTDLENQMKPSA